MPASITTRPRHRCLLESWLLPPLTRRYLRPSIQRFPGGRQQEALARQAGFAEAVHYPIGLGLMGCLVCRKA